MLTAEGLLGTIHALREGESVRARLEGVPDAGIGRVESIGSWDELAGVLDGVKEGECVTIAAPGVGIPGTDAHVLPAGEWLRLFPRGAESAPARAAAEAVGMAPGAFVTVSLNEGGEPIGISATVTANPTPADILRPALMAGAAVVYMARNPARGLSAGETANLPENAAIRAAAGVLGIREVRMVMAYRGEDGSPMSQNLG